MKTLIIIPAYNEEENIGPLLDELDKSYTEYDYIVINDCSKDATKSILKNRHTRFLDLPINLGIGGGVQAGYLYAMENGYDIAVQMDGDGQHMPEYLSHIVRPIKEGQADAVIGSRFLENEGFQSSAMRRIGIKFLSGLIKVLTGMRIYDVTSGFRAVNRKCIEAFANDYAQDYPEPEALVFSSTKGLKTIEVPVKMKERSGGESSITGIKTIYYMVKVSFALFISKVAKKR